MARERLFEYKGKQYVISDSGSFLQILEVTQLKITTSAAVIELLNAIFSRLGIAEKVHSDNGMQYAWLEFSQFASSYKFLHVTSSLRFPHRNGLVKCKLQKSKDLYLVLFSYRAL